MSNSFEKKIESAKEILEKLQEPQITLSDSVKAYEAGMKELKSAQEMIEKATLQVEQIKESK
ncbi:MAG: exodeoxyribonuclease VII small subunit [Campylobacterota bacterium]|nr:exodeoxyribonuclease VII small subunit [Campylobacterota bacterium]